MSIIRLTITEKKIGGTLDVIFTTPILSYDLQVGSDIENGIVSIDKIKSYHGIYVFHLPYGQIQE